MNLNDEDLIFETLLDYIKQSRGFDFTGYKRTTLKRRIRKRMQMQKLDQWSDYLDYLQVHPDEFLPLFNTILINVTGFFRDTNAWHSLRQLLSDLLSNKPTTQPVRAWSAGCSSGEEAYSLAIVLAEALGIESFHQRVKIYATDVDEEALNEARAATYRATSLEMVPQELRERYFEPSGEQYVFRTDLRRAVIFGRHDLMQDAPISRLDLLVCRNTLMYFNAETQAQILHRLHFALMNTGILFLGKAEMLLTHAALFTPIDLQHRLFEKVVDGKRDRRSLMSQSHSEESSVPTSQYLRLRELAFDAVPIAQLLLDVNNNLVLANRKVQSMFNISLDDIGRPFQNLEVSYRPIELRSHVDSVRQDRHPVEVTNVLRHLPDGTKQYLTIQVVPIQDESELLGVSISFRDVSRYHDLQEELRRTNQELETANEELQSSNEELETTNEELQSTNEELETTNEELQSTNEELETINEELQSSNEELQTINDELRQRTREVNQANAFMNSILASLQAGVVVVDRQFRILSWNDASEDLWGLRADEVQEQTILNLDIGLPVERLAEPLRRCLTGEVEGMEIEAINRRGQTIQCCLSFYPLIDPQKDRIGVILLMETV